MRTLSFIFNNGEARSFGRRIAAFDAAARAEPWPACIHKIFWNAETVFDRLRYILYNVIIDSKEEYAKNRRAPDERQFRPMERDLKKMDAAGMLMIFSVFPTARYVLGPYAL